MDLTPENVQMIFEEVSQTNLRDDDSSSDDSSLKIESVELKVTFDSQKLKAREADIISMLSNLPESFRASSGGGWSFLNLCLDKDENQWTGSHLRMDQLVALGLGIEKVSFLVPRTLWGKLPGGMPYLVVMDK